MGTYGNATIEPTSVACSLTKGLDNTGPLTGPSRFCGPSATTANGLGVPTVLFTSSEYGFRNAYFQVAGSYNTRCAVQSTFWQMTSMQCALPYVPTYTIVPPQPVACKPKVSAYWTIQQTPCGACPKQSNGQSVPYCEFSQFRNYGVAGRGKYAVPTTRDANNQAWTCVYNNNKRLAGQQNLQWCSVAGVGLEGLDGTNAQFTPRFPGTYKLNYTIVDGCNPPKVYSVTITAKCVTQAKMPVVPNAVTNFYCQGDPQSTATNVAGAFQKVDLWALSHKQINIVEGSTFSNPTPQDITGVCYVAPTIYTCTSLRTYFNTLNFQPFIDSSVSDEFKQCCNCLYSLTIINGGNSGNTPTPSPTPSTTTPSTTTPPGTSGSPNGNGGNQAGSNSALTAEEAKRRRNENILIGLAAPLGVILIASMALNAYMVLKLRQGGPSKGGFNVEAGDVELSTSPSRHMDV